MACPFDERHEIRLETSEGRYSIYCTQCTKHIDCCGDVHGMSTCTLHRGHDKMVPHTHEPSGCQWVMCPYPVEYITLKLKVGD
jgi:hypothetical protein